MKIDFFEEFPENLEKAKLIDFSSIIFIASKSLKEFENIEVRLKKINKNLKTAYWPILEKSYWISPFSYNYELKKLFNELKNNKRKIKILLDLELPVLNKKLFFINLFSFFKNKKLIGYFIKNSRKYNIEVYTAEYPVLNLFIKKIFEFLGISYSLKKYKYKRIVMMYSSAINKFVLKKIKKFIIEEHKKYKEKVYVGLGVISKGIFGNENILTPENLDRDLEFLTENKIQNAVIFRLNGLNKKYLEVINKYVS